jgi:hypothetical protein
MIVLQILLKLHLDSILELIIFLLIDPIQLIIVISID